MNNPSKEFNRQLELDVLVNGLTEITKDYVSKFKFLKLSEVIIPEGVTKIGDWAFAYCEGLKHAAIPASVTSIGDFAFFRCYGLKNLAIPERTSIGDRAFYGCKGRIKRYVLCETIIEK